MKAALVRLAVLGGVTLLGSAQWNRTAHAQGPPVVKFAEVAIPEVAPMLRDLSFGVAGSLGATWIAHEFGWDKQDNHQIIDRLNKVQNDIGSIKQQFKVQAANPLPIEQLRIPIQSHPWLIIPNKPPAAIGTGSNVQTGTASPGAGTSGAPALSLPIEQAPPAKTPPSSRDFLLTPSMSPCDAHMAPDVAWRRGLAFDRGEGAEQDAYAAAKCFGISARNGYTPAAYVLADMLLNGDGGVRINTSAGIGWLRWAADRGFVPAITRFAQALQSGEGMASPDPINAASYYSMAANAGDPVAQYRLAGMLFHGKGIPKDWFGAFGWLYIGDAEGYAPARETMRELLKRIEQDAYNGRAPAQYLVGIGVALGVPGIWHADHLAAFQWLRAASAQQYEPAIVALNNLCSADPSPCR